MENPKNPQKKSPLKKVLIGVGVFFALIVGILAVIPLFYNIDEFRPQIQEAVNKKVRGKVELGKLSFALIPSVRVVVDGVKATAPAPYDTKEPFLTLETLRLEMPLWSLITAPRATFRLVKPKVKMIQDEKGGNLAAFLPAPPPEGSEEATPPPAEAGPPAALGETLQGLPPWLSSRILAARFAAAVEDADIDVVQATMKDGEQIRLTAFNVGLEDIGLRAPVKLSVSGRPDVKTAGALVTGVFSVTGTATLDPQGATTKVALDVEQDFKELDIRYGSLFHKPAGVVMGLLLKAKVDQGASLAVDLEPIEFRFADLKFATNATLRDVGGEKATLKADLKMNDVKLAGFGAFVPIVESYDLDGSVALEGTVEGALKDPRFDISLLIKEAGGATPELKQPVSDMSGKIRIFGTAKDPQLKIEPLSMKVGNTDLGIRLATRGIDSIDVDFGLTSKRFDADQLLGLKPVVVGAKGEGAATTTGGAGGAEATPAAASTAPLDESLAQMAPTVEEALKNPMLDKISAKINVKIDSIRALGADFTNGTFQMSLAKRKLVVEKTGLGGYGGRVGMAARLDLVPEALGVDFNSDLQGVRIENMTAVHVPTWSKEMTGSLTGLLTLQMKGLRREQVEANLRGGLKGEVVKGRLNLPIMKVLGIVMESVPPIAGKKLETPKTDKEFRGDFKTMRIQSSFAGRKIVLDELNVTYDTLDARAKEVKFVAGGTVTFDRQLDMLGTAFLAPELIPVKELKGPSGQVEIPLKLGGTMAEPKPDIGYTTKLLAERLARGLLAGQAEALKAKLAEEKAKLEAQLAEERRKAEAKVAEERARAEAKVAEEKARAEAEAKARIEAEAKKAAEGLKKKFKL